MARGTITSSANIGRVLWLKKANTHETNEMAMKHLSRSFDSRMTVLLAALRHAERLLFLHDRLI